MVNTEWSALSLAAVILAYDDRVCCESLSVAVDPPGVSRATDWVLLVVHASLVASILLIVRSRRADAAPGDCSAPVSLTAACAKCAQPSRSPASCAHCAMPLQAVAAAATARNDGVAVLEIRDTLTRAEGRDGLGGKALQHA